MPRPPPRPPLFPYTTLFRSDLVCGRRMGARLSARASLQVIRIVLRAPAVSGGALSHRARAIRPAHHEAGSDTGDLSRGGPDQRRQAALAEDRTARLRLGYRARLGFQDAVVHRASGGELRSSARGPIPA